MHELCANCERSLPHGAIVRRFAEMARMPLMTTGGIRRCAVAERVLAGGMTLVGLGTALAYEPDLPMRWQHAEAVAKPVAVNWKSKALASLATMAAVRRQLHRMGAGCAPSAHAWPVTSLLIDRLKARRSTRRYLQWRREQVALQG